MAIHQRRFDDAIATYKRVLAMSPNDPLASAGLGAALDMQGDHAAAQSMMRAALQANPGDPMLSVNLGLSLVLAGNPREGANVLLDVTRFPAAPPQARQNLALAYGLLGNDEAAAQILSRDLPKASVQDNLRYYAIQRAARSRQARGSRAVEDGGGHGNRERATKRPVVRLPFAFARRLARDERSVSAIEFAIVGPVVILLMLGTVEIALDMFVDASVQLAAQQASRVGLTTVAPSSGTRDDQARAIVRAYLSRWEKIGGTVTISTYNYGTYGNVSSGTYQSGMDNFGDVVSYNVAVTISGFSGIPKWFGIKLLTFSRNYLVQNEK